MPLLPLADFLGVGLLRLIDVCLPYLGVIMVVCVGFATLLASTRRREGSMGDTRLSPIALALREVALAGQAEPTAKLPCGRGEADAEQDQGESDSS